jgi:hypothetical protein
VAEDLCTGLPLHDVRADEVRLAKSFTLMGDGYDWANNSSTMLDFAALPAPATISDNTSGVGTLNVIKFQDIGLSGTFTERLSRHLPEQRNRYVFGRSGNRVCSDGIHVLNCLERTFRTSATSCTAGSGDLCHRTILRDLS